MAEYSPSTWLTGEIIDSTRLNLLETQFQKGSSNYGYKRYSTGNTVTLFQTTTTYAGNMQATDRITVALYFQIPSWVERSRIDYSFTMASCSSNGYAKVCLFAGRHSVGGLPDYSITNPNYVSGYITSTDQLNSTAAQTFTTQLWINGGENYWMGAYSTDGAVHYVNIYDIKMTGVETTYNPISNAWGTIYSTVN